MDQTALHYEAFVASHSCTDGNSIRQLEPRRPKNSKFHKDLVNP
jgi:hypothetical protein